LISSAGAVLLVQTARVSGLDRLLGKRLAPWRLPLAVHDPGKIVLEVAIAVALGGDCAADIAAVRAQRPVRAGGVGCDGIAVDRPVGRGRRGCGACAYPGSARRSRTTASTSLGVRARNASRLRAAVGTMSEPSRLMIHSRSSPARCRRSASWISS
jgi:hypothetical protein